MREMGFVPYGEWMPDSRYLSNEGLRVADGVVPAYGSYISAPATLEIATTLGSGVATARGLHVDRFAGSGYAWIDVPGFLSKGRIYEILENGTATNVSQAGNYALGCDFAYGCNFGTTVVMTDRFNPVQYRPSGAATFTNMITSTFAPAAALCFSLRNNLFLANCLLSAGYDGIPSGSNTTLVAWSKSDDVRQFGSFNADPQIIGAGYQQLNFDIGDITAVCGSVDFAVIAHSNGFVRVDGPPYTFRVLAQNIGTVWPYGICSAGIDIYAFTQAGLVRFRQGDGQPELIGSGRFVRSLLDNLTGFSNYALSTDSVNTRQVSMAHDPINDMLLIGYASVQSGNSAYPDAILAYNIQEDRASWFQPAARGVSQSCYPLFLRPGKNDISSWSPGRDIRMIRQSTALNSNDYARFVLEPGITLTQTLGRGFIQFKRGQTTRIKRLRPVYTVVDIAAAEHVSLTIESVNKPYNSPVVSGPYTELDGHGWILTPDTVFADFHAPKLTTVYDSGHKVVENLGFEYEIEIGGVYSE